ncbi:M20/M25/M40 family metallo-hydrolase [Paludifilum halophilum]|uniref:Aminopeptidase n=1 Tax=Paludifilum halophilum TaxID=1642702 RepID=A0A235B4P7_9BACL|nr:M20/M25/M40 family metallo-hydrolase [Paludifilum halophilum]OYD07264.1 hypothetical protein CHM34_12850 [Paludifilum halophilum]
MKRNLRWAVTAITLAAVLIFTSSAYAAAPDKHQSAVDRISQERIYGHIAKLANKDNARVTGFEGEHKAADYIAEKLKQYGVKVERQYFPIIAYMDKGSEVTVNKPEAKTLKSANFNFTPATPDEGLTGEVVYAGLGAEDDFRDVDVEGKIALIQRGEYTFYDKTQNAAQAGAEGVIIFNNVEGELSGTLGEPTDIPAVSLNQEQGEELKSLLDKGQTVEVTMKADVEMSPSYSQNVIGTIEANKGSSKKAKTIVVGAHYDGVDTPAANDNASGTATLLEVSKALSQEKLRHDVKVIFFGAEEVGLVGSHHYVDNLSDEERAKTAAMINMDMVGVGDTIGVLTGETSTESFVTDMAEDYVQSKGYEYNRGTSTRSDHAPFAEDGIPVAFLNYGPDPNYHTDQDTLDKINKDNLGRMGSIVTTLTHDLANTKELPPKKNKAKKQKFNKQNQHRNPEFKEK